MANALVPVNSSVPDRVIPRVPWRDPHSVPKEELIACIQQLEVACKENPESSELRVCLGMAYAMNFDAYRSMDVLAEARILEPDSFWAQYKYSELHYRLRALEVAEDETKRALDLATNNWEVSLVRKQLAEIRRLRREGTQRPALTKSLETPLAMLVLLFLICSILVVYR